MSDRQSYANQLGWTVTTRDYLNNLNSEMRYIANIYTNKVDLLRQSNYISEELDKIQQMQNEFNESVNDLIKHIEQEHLSYIETQAKQVRKNLEATS